MRTYLDHNATSPLRREAKAAMLAALEAGGNASSIHFEGRSARKFVDDARETIARAVGAIAPMVIFTSGGTEANNLAIKGAGAERFLLSAIEHPSVIEAARATGKPVDFIPADLSGTIIPESLPSLLKRGPNTLVSVMLANNETGVIQPVREIANIAHDAGALLHVDAVQGLGKIGVNFALLGADMMTFTAHKLGGPVGAGALIVRDGLVLEPLMHGGGQELRRRAGTENIAAIAGFAATVEKGFAVKELRDRLESNLEGAVIVGAGAERLPNTACFYVPGIKAETLVMNFDLEGIAISSGSACSSGKVSKSHVLAAMGIDETAIRVSLGWNSTEEDVNRFLAAHRKIMARLSRRAA
ncbi:MAG: cysteine desulfurase [Rhizobiales bacterium]|nr:cysteine desulfurase [Hyphomicrobiales bacterium]